MSLRQFSLWICKNTRGAHRRCIGPEQLQAPYKFPASFRSNRRETLRQADQVKDDTPRSLPEIWTDPHHVYPDVFSGMRFLLQSQIQVLQVYRIRVSISASLILSVAITV